MRKLEDLVSAKDRFIGSVSHELRTPLAVVVGLAAELEEHVDTFTVEERDEFLGMIRRQSTEVSDIIDDLLVSTRIAETELTVINERFRLDELVSGVLRDLPLEITAKVAAVQLAATEVEADPLRTRRIVRNLITNANRYGGDRIEITVQPSGGRAVPGGRRQRPRSPGGATRGDLRGVPHVRGRTNRHRGHRSRPDGEPPTRPTDGWRRHLHTRGKTPVRTRASRDRASAVSSMRRCNASSGSPAC